MGMVDVFVNGRPVFLDGKITDERPGKALRGPDLGCCDRKGFAVSVGVTLPQSRRVMCSPGPVGGIMARHGRIPPESEFLMVQQHVCRSGLISRLLTQPLFGPGRTRAPPSPSLDRGSWRQWYGIRRHSPTAAERR